MSPHRAEIGDKVTRISRQLRRSVRGLQVAPHHFRTMRVIAAAGAIRPARLAEALDITPRAVTDVVDALVEAGLVVSEQDPQDRRAKILSLTELGEQRTAEAKALRDAAAEEMFSSLDDDEQQMLGHLLQKVLDGAASRE